MSTFPHILLPVWYVPSICGDFRLEAKTATTSILTVEAPTPAEAERLTRFLQLAQVKGWLGRFSANARFLGRSQVKLSASVAEAGRLLVEGVDGAPPGTLTVVRSVKGEITAEEAPVKAVERAGAKAEKTGDAPAAAVTVRRATPCCPDAFVAAERRASVVLRAFLDPDAWERWIREGVIYCEGGLSGHRYRIAHRHSPIAARQTRICFDLTDGGTLHFHDTLMPPPEEVLAAKLILENREDWLRNESTCLGPRFSNVFVNPLGPRYSDGVPDAWLTCFLAGQMMADLAGLGEMGEGA